MGKERAKKKKEEKSRLEKERLQITKERKDLHQPVIKPGCLNVEYVSFCETVDGVLNLVLPPWYLQKILDVINSNRFHKEVLFKLKTLTYCFRIQTGIQKATKEAKRNDYPRRIIRIPNGPLPIRKGHPGYVSRVHPLSYRRISVRSRSRGRRTFTQNPLYHSPISMRELKRFLGIIIYSAENPVDDLRQLWNKTKHDEPQHGLIQLTMSYARFALIYQCFRFSEDEMLLLEFDINEHILKLWIPSNIAVVDESICPHKGRQNPHHVFIARKPHPHGMKNWSLVDFSGYLLKYSLFRRNRSQGQGGKEVYEATEDTLLRMSSAMPPNSLICADSYFGSIRAMEKLAKTGKHSLFSMNQSRPSFLFKEGVCSEVRKDGESSTLYGEVSGKRNDEKIPFLANAFQSKGRMLCTLSTVYSDAPCEKELEILVEDDSEENQQQFQKLKEVRPEVRIKYAEIMDFVDRADQHINAALSRNRKKHWSTAQKLWEVTMLLVVNAKKIYESATGVADLSGPIWKKMVRRTLLGLPTDEKAPHPLSCKSNEIKNSKARCRACSTLFGKDRRTVWRCSICGPICKYCECQNKDGKTPHLEFYQMPASSRSIRRPYTVPQ